MAGGASLKSERAHRENKYSRWRRPLPEKEGGVSGGAPHELSLEPRECPQNGYAHGVPCAYLTCGLFWRKLTCKKDHGQDTRVRTEIECAITGNPGGVATLKSKSDLVARLPNVDRAPTVKKGMGLAGGAFLKPEGAHRKSQYCRWGRPAPEKGRGVKDGAPVSTPWIPG